MDTNGGRTLTDEDEKDLSRRLAASLDGHFEELVLTYQDRLYAFALRLTGSTRDAEEIAQDAFVRAYRALERYPAAQVETLALRAWLYRITLNAVRNRVRGRRLRLVPLDDADGAAALERDDGGGARPEMHLERAEQRRELAAHVAALPERFRAAVVLRYISGLGYAEAADILGQPVGTVKANVHRGIRLLRESMIAQMSEVG